MGRSVKTAGALVARSKVRRGLMGDEGSLLSKFFESLFSL